MTSIMKRKSTAPLDESDVHSDDDNSFDAMEFAALSQNDDKIQALRRVKEQQGVINNEQGLLNKFEEIVLPTDWPWIETMTITLPNKLQIDDIEDDLKREAAFYQAATQAVKLGIIQLEHSKVPYKRPVDYYAESVKPDSHMAKVKQVLLNEKKRIQEVEERKRVRESKKFAKSVHSQRLKDKALQKRQTLDKIDRIKAKSRGNNAE